MRLSVSSDVRLLSFIVVVYPVYLILELYCLTLIAITMQRLLSLWKKRFGEDVNEDLIYTVAVEQVLQIEDFQEV